jgi:hypothetical protein
MPENVNAFSASLSNLWDFRNFGGGIARPLNEMHSHCDSKRTFLHAEPRRSLTHHVCCQRHGSARAWQTLTTHCWFLSWKWFSLFTLLTADERDNNLFTTAVRLTAGVSVTVSNVNFNRQSMNLPVVHYPVYISLYMYLCV